MLSPDQIQTARSSLGITPQAAPTQNRLAELQQAWGSSNGANSTPSYISQVGEAAKSGFNAIVDAGKKAGPIGGDITKLPEAALEAAGGIANVVGAPAAPAINAVAQPIVKKASDALAETKPLQEYGRGVAEGAPDTAQRVTEDIANANAGFGVAASLEGVPKAGAAATDNLKKLSNFLQTPGDATVAAKQAVASSPNGLLDTIRAKLAKGNVDPRLKTSAGRLAETPEKPGSTTNFNPVNEYNTYAKQATNAVKDVKADTPIATVGSKIGDAYDQVVNARRAVGKQMGDALKGVADTPADISGTYPKLQSDLENNYNLTHDFGNGKLQNIQGKETPLTTEDRVLVGKYMTDLKALGDSPTLANLDAFMKRVPQELDVAKAAKNITTVTPGERLIKTSLSDLRNAFDPEKTGNAALEPYHTARTAYANLSNFLDEGSRYLGAKTQSGDYARDVSIAKSSAESLLGGGKKDWLAKLEGLTGYPALDHATLAIQAMKDAGDQRGLSLFKSLGETAAHPSSITAKVLQFAAKKAAGRLIGTPEDQTRAFLQSLSRAKTKGSLPTK